LIFKVKGQGQIFRRGDTPRIALPLFFGRKTDDCIDGQMKQTKTKPKNKNTTQK
jgi:hypothetical protein